MDLPRRLSAARGRLAAGAAAATAAVLAAAAPLPAAAQPNDGLEPLLPAGSPFHGVHGLRFDASGLLYAGSVVGQSIFTVDVDTRDVKRLIGPPEGMADDIAIAPDGTMFWTAIEDGIVYKRRPGGRIERFVENVKGANAISFSRDFERLFYTLVFYGDALYELDPSGAAPPRLIDEGLGGLNAFDVADDGMIYGPLMFGGRVARVDPDTGEIETVSDEFASPGALKLEGNGSAYGSAFVLDGAELKRVVLRSGYTTTVTELPSDGDNLAISDVGLVYVSLASENAIVEVDPVSGVYGYLVGPSPLVSPAGLAVSSDGGTLYAGDMMGGLRAIDTETAEITNIPNDIFQPTHVSTAGPHLVAAGEVFGEIERFDPATYALIDRFEDFDVPHDVLETPDGDLIVAETGSGRVLRVTGAPPGERTVVAGGLAGPTGLAWAGDGTIYVTETAGGRLLEIDVDSGDSTVVAEGLAQPEGVAVDRRGRALVVEVAARRLVRISGSGRSHVIEDDLPIGLSNGPSLYRGIAVDGDGNIYLTSDVDNTIYRVD